MTSKKLYWNDAHFCGLRSQTNIYGLSKIALQEGLTRLLAVSIDGHFITVEYQKSFDNRLIPITREDEFFMTSALHGPAGAGDLEIVSVDMIYQDGSKTEIILAVTFLPAPYEEKAASAYMNIYFLSAQEDSPINRMDAGAMFQVELEFYPLKLMHHQVEIGPEQLETCFILSGNDSKVHVFRQAKNMQQFYRDQAMAKEYFPEFLDVNGCVTQIELKTLDSSHRMAALGVQSGLVTVFLVNTITHQIEKRWETDMDSPITSIQLFYHHVKAPRPDFLQPTEDYPCENVEPVESAGESINLLITSAIDPAVVFCDVLESDLNKRHVLPLSNSQDVVLCSCIMDIDFDGENEILIGTYGQVLLAYKLMMERTPCMLMTSTPFQSPKPVPVGPSLLDPPAAAPSTILSEEKPPPPPEQEKSDRRRHKSMAGTLDSNDNLSKHEKHDRHRSDDSSLLEGYLREGQVARLVRSQENLAAASPRSVCFQTPENSDSYEFLPHGSLPDLTEYPSYRLKWSKRFSDPVMGLTCDDMMGDGIMNLVVLTLKGLHILQPDLNEVAELLLERLRSLCGSSTKDKEESSDGVTEEKGVDVV